MSLRTTYTGALDTKLAEARDMGRYIVIDQNNPPNPEPDLESAIIAAADKGQTEFTYNAAVNFQAVDLRRLDSLWEAFKTGIVQGLSEQDILMTEVEVSLNTSQQTSTSVDLKFKFK